MLPNETINNSHFRKEIETFYSVKANIFPKLEMMSIQIVYFRERRGDK